MTKLAIFLMVAMMCVGCATVKTTATTMPDGGKRLEQVVHTRFGGNVEEGATDIFVESVASDGSNWNVKSGTGARGVVTPNTVQDVTQLVDKLGATYVAGQELQAKAAIESAKGQADMLKNILPMLKGISLSP